MRINYAKIIPMVLQLNFIRKKFQITIRRINTKQNKSSKHKSFKENKSEE